MKSKSTQALVREITYKPKHRAEIFMALEPAEQQHVLLRLSRHVQAQLLLDLHKETILSIFQYLDPDDVTDLLQTLSKKKQDALLMEMSEDLHTTLSMLLQFDPETAAGLMSLNYVQVSESQRLSEVAEEIQKHEKRTGRLPTTLVVNNGRLVGELPMQKLLFARPGDRVREYVRPMKSISYLTKSDSVVTHMLDNPHQRIAVLGEDDTILGVLYSDDVLRELEQREASTLYDFAGLHAEESVVDTVKMKVSHRYKWLVLNLGTSFFAAFTVGLFEGTISKHVLLAVYMPVVAGMGGNSATQTLAVLVRGISQKQIDLQTALPTLKREVGAGLINGVINGCIVFAVVMVLNSDIMVATVLGMAMVFNLVVAGIFGTLVPLIMKRLGKDPATSATIFITTATDVLGFLAFLGLASVLLN